MVTTTVKSKGHLCHGCAKRVAVVTKTSDGKYRCYDCAKSVGQEPLVRPAE